MKKDIGIALVALAVLASNVGSAYAGARGYEHSLHPEWSAPCDIWFQIFGLTLYPASVLLLAGGIYLIVKHNKK